MAVLPEARVLAIRGNDLMSTLRELAADNGTKKGSATDNGTPH